MKSSELTIYKRDQRLSPVECGRICKLGATAVLDGSSSQSKSLRMCTMRHCDNVTYSERRIVMAEIEDHGVSPSGIRWRQEPPTEEDRELVAKILANLSLVPDDKLSAEWARRAACRPGSGRQRILRPCPKCGQSYSARVLRLHIPNCK